MGNMRRRILMGAGIVLLAGLTSGWAAKAMSVQVRNGQLRATPSFLGKVVGPVNYGDRLDVLVEQSPWMNVRLADGRAGWMHESALTTKRVVMQAGQQTVATGASGNELALAGKGFSADVEAAFKAENKNIDFTWVNRMEALKVTPAELADFLQKGGVSGQGGRP
jgi:SH3-like domain-containing protein